MFFGMKKLDSCHGHPIPIPFEIAKSHKGTVIWRWSCISAHGLLQRSPTEAQILVAFQGEHHSQEVKMSKFERLRLVAH